MPATGRRGSPATRCRLRPPPLRLGTQPPRPSPRLRHRRRLHAGPGWEKSFPCSARTAAVTSDSEKTGGRSRLTRSERFASGRRPGSLRPREWPGVPLIPRCRRGASAGVCSWFTANHIRVDPGIRRHEQALVDEAIRSHRTRGINEPPGGRNPRNSAPKPEKQHSSGGSQGVPETTLGNREGSARGSPPALQPGNDCGFVIDRAMIPPGSRDRSVISGAMIRCEWQVFRGLPMKLGVAAEIVRRRHFF
jgi:hypothetical protein